MIPSAPFCALWNTSMQKLDTNIAHAGYSTALILVIMSDSVDLSESDLVIHCNFAFNLFVLCNVIFYRINGSKINIFQNL